MASTTFEIQILDKADYTKQSIVPLPDKPSLPPLTPGTIRIRSRILSISTNTFTYARLGHLVGWWGVWPFPAGLPEPYSNASTYGRISSWGYAEVVESHADDVPVGTKLFGYMPIGSYPETLQVEVDSETGQLLEVGDYRKHLLNMYNRYDKFPATMDLTENVELLGWTSVMRVLFETSYLLNRYVFTWDEKRTHPMGIPFGSGWNQDQADLNDALVLLLGPSSKTGLAFAYQLRRARPLGTRPRKVVAVGSAQSRDFSKATGLFDEVLLYSDSGNPDVIRGLGCETGTKVLVMIFSARGDADQEWFTAMQSQSDRVTVVIVGGDPKAPGRPKLAALAEDPTSNVVRCNASGLRDAAMAIEGRKAYFDGLEKQWQDFTKERDITSMKIVVRKGMQEFGEGWEGLSAGKYDPTSGLVFEV
ncbi:hypothetical protein BX600DRAFT_467246 [Xylariales sp. PMI_506]|nr:hypothetical protein BX600DRAFT_467246 [Xylariales sp. PMI_506]